jgi:hypothetical protein
VWTEWLNHWGGGGEVGYTEICWRGSQTVRGRCGGNRCTVLMSVLSVSMLFVPYICTYKQHTWTRYVSCFSFFNPSYPFSDRAGTHSSVTVHVDQMFANRSWLLAIGNRNVCHCLLFQPHFSLCPYRINGGPVIREEKQLWLVIRECSRTPGMLWLFAYKT